MSVAAAMHEPDPMSRAESMRLAHPQKTAAYWRIRLCEIDTIGIGTLPPLFLQALDVPDRTGLAVDFRFSKKTPAKAKILEVSTLISQHPKSLPQKASCIILQLSRIILQLFCIILQLSRIILQLFLRGSFKTTLTK